jgi:hypothetical protein
MDAKLLLPLLDKHLPFPAERFTYAHFHEQCEAQVPASIYHASSVLMDLSDYCHLLVVPAGPLSVARIPLTFYSTFVIFPTCAPAIFIAMGADEMQYKPVEV